MNQFQETFRVSLERRGLHVTRQRLSVAGQLFRMAGHPSVDELYDELREAEPGIGQATVYRTVKLLKDAGLAMELRMDDGTARFEVVRRSGMHEHLVCRSCGTVVEIHSPALEEAQAELAREHGFLLEEQARCAYGLCPDCRALQIAPGLGGSAFTRPGVYGVL